MARTKLVILLLALACCGGERRPFQQLDGVSPRRESSMSGVAEHARQGAAVRDAVERGDLDATKAAARGLLALAARRAPSAPDPRMDAMLHALREVVASRDLETAARSYALVALRCGECHVALGGGLPSFPATPPPDGRALDARMRRHHWGAARLWEGLVAPADEAWESGADALSDALLGAELLPGRTATPEIDALSAKVHDLGARASSAKQPAARWGIYGELLTTCAQCHRRLGGGPT